MKNIKSRVCFIFGILFLVAALLLFGTGNRQLVITAVTASVFLLLVSFHMHKEPKRYSDDDDDDF